MQTKETPAAKIAPKKLVKLLVKSILNNRQVLISGSPGIGKTDLVKKAVDVLRKSGMTVNLIILIPVVSDPTDFKGFPALVNGRAEFIPFGYLQEMIDADELTVVFFDDLGQATPAVQAAAMQLLLGREINLQKISDKCRFVAATNRKEDFAAVQGILEPVKSRFDTIVELNPDVTEWIDWAEKNQIHPLLIAYIIRKPEMLFRAKPSRDMTNAPSPRTVRNVSKWLDDWFGIDDELLRVSIHGAAGAEFAQDFMAFKEIADRMIDPRVCEANPDSAPVPDEPDIQFALTLALAERAKGDNWDNIIKYVGRIGKEFQKLLITSATRRKPSLKTELAYIKWAQNNPEMQN